MRACGHSGAADAGIGASRDEMVTTRPDDRNVFPGVLVVTVVVIENVEIPGTPEMSHR
jgi:hypothetical protein